MNFIHSWREATKRCKRAFHERLSQHHNGQQLMQREQPHQDAKMARAKASIDTSSYTSIAIEGWKQSGGTPFSALDEIPASRAPRAHTEQRLS